MTDLEYWFLIVLRFLYRHIYKVWIGLMIVVIITLKNCGE